MEILKRAFEVVRGFDGFETVYVMAILACVVILILVILGVR